MAHRKASTSDGSHAETPLMAQHRTIDMQQPPWSTASSSDLTAVGRPSYEKATLGSPLVFSHQLDEERLLPSHVAAKGQRRSWLHRLVRLAAVVGLVFLVHFFLDALQAFSLRHLSWTGRTISAGSGFDENSLRNSIFPSLADLCDICDCSTKPPSLAASIFPSRSHLQSSDLSALVKNAIIDVQCKQVYSTHLHSFTMIRQIMKDPASVLAWDLSRLEPGKQTTYMFTKTYAGGKVGGERAAYMQRHIDTMHRFDAKLHNASAWNGKYEDGTAAVDRQLVWIIVEDGPAIDQEVAATLAEGKISYIYFAYGPTHNFGNAQHNAALQIVHHLSNDATGMLGHGPVFGADDDAEIHEDLLMYVWRLKRIGLWPVGNLGKTGWEHAIWNDQNQITGWEASNTYRKYPVDNNGFAFNSTLLGSDLPGPAFWPTDTNGGETEFLELLVSHHDQLEPVCKDCHVAWHNHPINIPHLGNMTYRPSR